MNKCPKCGYEIGKNHKYCTNCGNTLVKANKSNNKTNSLMITNYICFGISLLIVIFSFIFDYDPILYSFNFQIVTLITIIIARIKQSNSKQVRITFIVEIIYFSLLLIYVTFLFVSCVHNTSEGCYEYTQENCQIDN